MKSLATALLLSSAIHAVIATVSTYSQVKCFTLQGPTKQANVATSTKAATLYLPLLSTTTYTPLVTLSASTTISTSTVYTTSTSVTTASQVTDTFTSTTTFFTTSTESDTTTTTTTSTATVSTTTTSTSTIPTSSGFTPVASVVAAEGQTASKRKRRVLRRGEDNKPAKRAPVAAAAKPACTIKAGNSGIVVTPAQYPQKVVCDKIVEVVTTYTLTATAKTTSTVTPLVTTSVVTTTSTLTVISTSVLMDASTTTTVSATSTLTSTTLTTVTASASTTTTSTSYAPAVTNYAACAPNNVIRYVSGNDIDSISPNNNYYSTSDTDPTSCCNSCQAAGSSCGGSLFLYGTCYFLQTSSDNSVCNPSQSIGTFYYDSEGSANDDYAIAISNSGCGTYSYGGPE